MGLFREAGRENASESKVYFITKSNFTCGTVSQLERVTW